MRRRSLALVAALTVAILQAPTAAMATAWSVYSYKITVGDNHAYADFCLRAGIVDTAQNQVQTHTYVDGTPFCGTANKNVASGSLAGYVVGYRDGSYCATSNTAYDSVAAYSFIVYGSMCSNPSGSQVFHTIGYGGVYDDGTECGCGGAYFWYSSTSPNQNY